MTLRQVIKRDNSIVAFEEDKIINSIYKVMEEIGEANYDKARELSNDVVQQLEEYIEDASEQHDVEDLIPSVGYIDDCVEEILMGKDKSLAKAYILFRDKKDKELAPDIFRPRASYRPYEYPQFIEFIDALHNSFWVFREFNFTSAIQNLKVDMTHEERTAALRSVLAIGTVESKVKSFWVEIGKMFPKSEFEELGAVIGNNEVIHAHAYTHILELMGLNEEFTKVDSIPAIKARMDYIGKSLAGRYGSKREYMKSLLFFSLFVENVSLFSQFLIISSFDKSKNMLNGISNVIQATSLEEDLHAKVGTEIINIIREENPEWFDDELEDEVYSLVRECYAAEKDIVDWIFEEGELPFLTKQTIFEYIKHRINIGLESCGFRGVYTVDESELSKVDWFEVQNKTTTHTDFFNKRSTNYTKTSQSFDVDDMF